MNNEVLKLLSVDKIPIKNCDACVLTYFKNVNTIYVTKAYELEKIKTLFDMEDSTGYCFK